LAVLPARLAQVPVVVGVDRRAVVVGVDRRAVVVGVDRRAVVVGVDRRAVEAAALVALLAQRAQAVSRPRSD
jgi:hypothetical protein